MENGSSLESKKWFKEDMYVDDLRFSGTEIDESARKIWPMKVKKNQFF